MKTFTNTLLLYKLAIVRFALFVLHSLCGSIMAALAGTEWSSADWQTRFLIVVGIVSSLTATLLAFFDKTSARIAEGKNPLVPEGNTQPPITTTS
jgi:hypothetical protein